MKTQKQIMLSVITPNHNDSKTIERQVDSIMDQDYKAIEQIIVDDGSTDESKKVLQKLEKKYKGRLKVIFLKENQGACIARNIGAKEAKGKYLSFLPADAKLYPGVARIWVETLENNPKYDFLYGGYKITDDDYNPIFDYLGDKFDPYFLKVTNYIDGSFPLKKELFDKMGGWDPAIKSLQDWDLWLNAVLRHNAIGIYKQEVFFETTAPHPGGLSADSHNNWIARTEQIKKKYGIEPKKICVTGQGATFHAKNVAKLLDADYQLDPSFKPHKYEMIYVIGFFGNVAKSFWNTRAMRVVHWIGSDILQVKMAPPEQREWVIKWLEHNVDINLCEFETTRKELEELGIKARIVPFPPEKMYDPIPLPEKFAVACYLPYNNAPFYNPDLISDVAMAMPDVNFYYFGNPILMGNKNNIFHCGTVNMFEKEDLIKKTSMILRVVPHDGLPLSVIEWITAGRNALTTVKIDHATKLNVNLALTGDKKKDERIMKENKKEIIRQIRLIQKQKLNTEGSKFYKKLCDVKKFKDTIYGFMKFDIKKWWKEIGDFWEMAEGQREETSDISAVIKEIKELKPKTLLDIGCGSGRWADLLPSEGYTGIDFSKKLIEIAKKKHSDQLFFETDIMDYKVDNKFDVVFSFATLLHVPPEKIKDYIAHLKTLGKKGVFVEPTSEFNTNMTTRVINQRIIEKQKKTDWIFNVKYTWIHDYLNLLGDIEKVIPLSNNRSMFIVNLEK
jgi:SAM-dependent methyltransferase